MKLRSQGISWRRTGDEIVVLDLHGSEYFALNASAALLWERLAAAPHSVSELEGVLETEYGLAPAQAGTDVAAFVATLRAHGLIEE